MAEKQSDNFRTPPKLFNELSLRDLDTLVMKIFDLTDVQDVDGDVRDASKWLKANYKILRK